MGVRSCHPGSVLGTALSPLPSQVGTSRYSTAEHCLEGRGQGSVLFLACETLGSFLCKHHQTVLVVLHPTVSCSPSSVAFESLGLTAQLFAIVFNLKEYSAPCNMELPQCKMISYQSGSFMLTRKYGNAQIFVGRKDISTEVLWMLYRIGKLSNNKINSSNLLPASSKKSLLADSLLL